MSTIKATSQGKVQKIVMQSIGLDNKRNAISTVLLDILNINLQPRRQVIFWKSIELDEDVLRNLMLQYRTGTVRKPVEMLGFSHTNTYPHQWSK